MIMGVWKPIKKVMAAIFVGAVVETGVLIAALSGAIAWGDAGIAMLAAALPIVAAYLKTETDFLEDGVGLPPEDDVE
jgi:hypothetical protein